MSANLTGGTRGASAGDIVVPFSEIIERLGPRVGADVLQDILRDILARRRREVRPGELITAELMNQILAQLASLETRVAALESRDTTTATVPTPAPTPVAITELRPPGARRAGEELEVRGRNFLRPAENNRVRVGSVTVSPGQLKSRSSETLLVFDIPLVPEVQKEGGPVDVEVRNTNGVATARLQLLPVRSFPSGRLEVFYTMAPILPEAAPNITAGRSFDFIFSVAAFVDIEATYNLATKITSGWTAQVLRDSDSQPLNQITLAGDPLNGVRRDVRVRVTPPAGATSGTGSLELTVTESSGGGGVPVGRNPSPVEIVIGSPPPVPETRIRVSLRSISSGATEEGGRIRYVPGTTGVVSFSIAVAAGAAVAGNYTVTAEFRNPAGWTVNSPPAAGTTFTVDNNGGGRPVNISAVASASASDTDLIVNVRRATGGEAFTVRYMQPVTVAKAA